MTQAQSPKRVVAIDDDPAMTEYLSMFLQSQGYEVFEANRGSDGVRLVNELDPDLILLDLKMPEMSGLEVCTRVRAFSTAPILVLSAMDGPEDVASILDAGADDYITKPVTGGMLIARLHTLSRRAAPRSHKTNPRHAIA